MNHHHLIFFTFLSLSLLCVFTVSKKKNTPQTFSISQSSSPSIHLHTFKPRKIKEIKNQILFSIFISSSSSSSSSKTHKSQNYLILNLQIHKLINTTTHNLIIAKKNSDLGSITNISESDLCNTTPQQHKNRKEE